MSGAWNWVKPGARCLRFDGDVGRTAHRKNQHARTRRGFRRRVWSVKTGLLAISAKAPLQVSEASAADLQRVDAGDFPDWAGNSADAMALAYRYVRPGYKLALDVRRFDEVEVLQALVDSAQFTSVVADDGQMMTEMSLSVAE